MQMLAAVIMQEGRRPKGASVAVGKLGLNKKTSALGQLSGTSGENALQAVQKIIHASRKIHYIYTVLFG